MLPINKKISAYNHYDYNTIKYIVVHDVGTRSTAKNNVDYFSGGNRNASAHYFVDDTSIWQSVEDSKGAWHVGDNKNVSDIYNTNSIGIEMCLPSGTVTAKTEANTVELVKYLMKKYNVPINRVVRHYDASRKNCPAQFNLDGKWTRWTAFKKKLTTTTVQPPKTEVKPATAQNSKPKVRQITVDGKWGADTTRRLQEVLGTPIDGVISGQDRRYITNILSARAGQGGSLAIKAMQRKLGVKADGYLGPNTFRALQKHYGTPVDGVISPVSNVVMAMQRALNSNKF